MRGRVRARQRRVKALTRCQKVKLRREREIWNPYIVFLVREENKNFCNKKKSAIFSYFQKIKRNFKNKSHDLRGDQDFENSNFSWQEREIFLFFFCPKNEKLSLPQRGVLKSNSKVLLLTEVKILLNNTDLLSLSAKHCCSKSNHTVKHDFSPELEEKLREESRGETEFFFSQNFDSQEENIFAKSHSIEKTKRNFLQNLEFWEENENFVFKILTIENISRKEHSILQLEIEKKWTISSRDCLEIENLVNVCHHPSHAHLLHLQ